MSTCWQTVGFADRAHSSWVSLTQSSSTRSEDYVGLNPHHSSNSWSSHQTQPFFSSRSHLMGCWFQTESQVIHLISSPPPSLSICLPKALSMVSRTPERSQLHLPTLPNLRAALLSLLKDLLWTTGHSGPALTQAASMESQCYPQ